jgi:hypothetical protein
MKKLIKINMLERLSRESIIEENGIYEWEKDKKTVNKYFAGYVVRRKYISPAENGFRLNETGNDRLILLKAV